MSHDIVAIVAAFNEADVIRPSVEALLGEGVGVYLLDHGSTDGTVDAVRDLEGQGLLGVESLEGRGFALAEIVARKLEIARRLGARWVINHDADEFRESPWPHLDLARAIALVDRCGYDAIDFAVFDFWPTDDDFRPGEDPRTHFRSYRAGGTYDRVQIRCWRQPTDGRPVDLESSGGHDTVFPGRRIFPIRFVLRHYPFRSQAHGERKLFEERRPRYDRSEVERGWHVQHETVEPGFAFVRPEAELARWDPDRVRVALQIEHRLVEELRQDPAAAAEATSSRARALALAERELEARNRELVQVHERADDAARARDRLGSRVAEIEARLDAQNRRSEAIDTTLDQHNRELEELHRTLDRRNRELEELHRTLDQRNHELERAVGELEEAQRAFDLERQRTTDLTTRLEAILASRSWRWTAPFRRETDPHGFGPR